MSNTKKAFKEGHTHMKCFKSAKTVIDLVIRKKVPRSNDLYYLTSLIRLSEDLAYITKINDLIKYKEEKSKSPSLRCVAFVILMLSFSL